MMEGLDLMGGITTIFGFLAVCLVIIWKVVSDKKDNDKQKEMQEKVAKILEYITTEREKNTQEREVMQKQIQANTTAIEKITEILDGISKKMSKFAPKTKSNNHNKTKENE